MRQRRENSNPMDRTGRSDVVWWLRPAVVFAAGSTFVGLAAYLISDWSYVLYWRSVKYMTASALLLVLGSVASFVVGTWIANALVNKREATPANWRVNVPWRLVGVLFQFSFWACVAAYVVWTAVGVARGLRLQHLAAVIQGEKGVVEDLKQIYLQPVTGVTTFTQVGIVAVVLGVVLGTGLGWRRVWQKIAVVFVLAATRAFFFSERLALVELFVPFVVCAVGLGYSEWKPRRRRAARLLPILAPVLLLLFFTGFEYFRSWSNYYAGGRRTLAEFGATRLLGYYATAMDNAAYLFKALNPPIRVPYFTLNFLWRFPGLSGTVTNLSAALPYTYGEGYMVLLEAGANPEFNNASGVLLPFLDYGSPAGFVYWLMAGVAVQLLFRSFARREFTGICLYPLVYVGVLEAPRILYWADGRAFLPYVFLGAAAAAHGYVRRQYGRPALVSA